MNAPKLFLAFSSLLALPMLSTLAQAETHALRPALGEVAKRGVEEANDRNVRDLVVSKLGEDYVKAIEKARELAIRSDDAKTFSRVLTTLIWGLDQPELKDKSVEGIRKYNSRLMDKIRVLEVASSVELEESQELNRGPGGRIVVFRVPNTNYLIRASHTIDKDGHSSLHFSELRAIEGDDLNGKAMKDVRSAPVVSTFEPKEILPADVAAKVVKRSEESKILADYSATWTPLKPDQIMLRVGAHEGRRSGFDVLIPEALRANREEYYSSIPDRALSVPLKR